VTVVARTDARPFNSRKAEAMSLRIGESVVSLLGSALDGEVR